MRMKTWSLLASLAQPLSVLSSCCSWGSRLASSFGGCSKSWGWGRDESRSDQFKEHCKVPSRGRSASSPIQGCGGEQSQHRDTATALPTLKNGVSFVNV